MDRPIPNHEAHPRLYQRCLELVGDDDAARILCTIVVKTAHNEGRGGIILEGEPISLPPHIRKMKLHELMGAAH